MLNETIKIFILFLIICVVNGNRLLSNTHSLTNNEDHIVLEERRQLGGVYTSSCPSEMYSVGKECKMCQCKGGSAKGNTCSDSWDDDGAWCYLEGGLDAKDCPGAKLSNYGNKYWSNEMCCNCIGGNGWGNSCSVWDSDGEWCYLDFGLNATCQNTYLSNNGGKYWSTHACNREDYRVAAAKSKTCAEHTADGVPCVGDNYTPYTIEPYLSWVVIKDSYYHMCCKKKDCSHYKAENKQCREGEKPVESYDQSHYGLESSSEYADKCCMLKTCGEHTADGAQCTDHTYKPYTVSAKINLNVPRTSYYHLCCQKKTCNDYYQQGQPCDEGYKNYDDYKPVSYWNDSIEGPSVYNEKCCTYKTCEDHTADGVPCAGDNYKPYTYEPYLSKKVSRGNYYHVCCQKKDCSDYKAENVQCHDGDKPIKYYYHDSHIRLESSSEYPDKCCVHKTCREHAADGVSCADNTYKPSPFESILSKSVDKNSYYYMCCQKKGCNDYYKEGQACAQGWENDGNGFKSVEYWNSLLENASYYNDKCCTPIYKTCAEHTADGVQCAGDSYKPITSAATNVARFDYYYKCCKKKGCHDYYQQGQQCSEGYKNEPHGFKSIEYLTSGIEGPSYYNDKCCEKGSVDYELAKTFAECDGKTPESNKGTINSIDGCRRKCKNMNYNMFIYGINSRRSECFCEDGDSSGHCKVNAPRNHQNFHQYRILSLIKNPTTCGEYLSQGTKCPYGYKPVNGQSKTSADEYKSNCCEHW